MKLFEGALLKIDGHHRFWVVLKITEEDIKESDISTETPGLYAFGGMWYGDSPHNHKSYGKMLEISQLQESKTRMKIVGNTRSIPNWQIKSMVE